MDVENIERPNHIKPTRLKSHIEPALTQAIKFMHFTSNEESPFISIQLKLDFLTWDAETGILHRTEIL